jgi:hypothetical protein
VSLLTSKTKQMKAKVNTKSNYKGLNGQWLEVKEIVGTRVTCIVTFAEFGKQSVDFTLKEVTELDTTKSVETNLNPIFEQALKPFCIN